MRCFLYQCYVMSVDDGQWELMTENTHTCISVFHGAAFELQTKLNERTTNFIQNKNSVSWVRERAILIEQPPLVSEVSADSFADWGCHVVSVTNSYGCNLGFLDWSRYFFFQVAPQLCSRGWVDPIPDPLLLRKYRSAGNRTRTFGSVARNSDH
jgi:hypothetical protein